MKKTNKKCSSEDIALKAYFLGPQAENADFFQKTLHFLTENYCHWRAHIFPQDGSAISEIDTSDSHFVRSRDKIWWEAQKLANAFQKEIPKFSPRYIGHMFSDLSLPGLLGHWLSLLHNSNNISKESSKIGTKIEIEAISFLSKMLHWRSGIGHFTSGGSIANLEALVRMKKSLHGDISKAVLIVSPGAHYSWHKAMDIAGFDRSNICEIPLDSQGRLSTVELQRKLKILEKNRTPILGIVSLFGSTELGTVDDLEKINKILKSFSHLKIWHHVDAAYGGFFASTKSEKNIYLNRQIDAFKDVKSVTLDPHKLGYIPYACGAFLCQDKKSYYHSQLEIPYIHFSSAQEIGVQSIEGSRPATGATAMWLVSKTMGLKPQGLGKVLNRHLMAKKNLQLKMHNEIKGLIFPPGLDLNILCWSIETSEKSLSASNACVQHLYKSLPKGSNGYFVAKTSLNLKKHQWLKTFLQEKTRLKLDSEHCDFIRMTLMNPFLTSKEMLTKFDKDLIAKINATYSCL